jgi:SSS family solute:Na+ symporter
VTILTSLGTMGMPQMLHKFYTIKDEKSIKTGTVISTLFALVTPGEAILWGHSGACIMPFPPVAIRSLTTLFLKCSPVPCPTC